MAWAHGSAGLVGVLEVQVVARRRRPALALVLGLRRRGAVWLLRGAAHAQERDLTDLHPGIDRDREGGHIRQLERQVAVPSRIDEAGGAVNEQAEPARGALALQPGHQV